MVKAILLLEGVSVSDLLALETHEEFEARGGDVPLPDDVAAEEETEYLHPVHCEIDEETSNEQYTSIAIRGRRLAIRNDAIIAFRRL